MEPDPNVIDQMKNTGEAIKVDNEEFIKTALIKDTISEKPRTLGQDALSYILENIDTINKTLQFGTVDEHAKTRLNKVRDRLLNLIESANIIANDEC